LGQSSASTALKNRIMNLKARMIDASRVGRGWAGTRSIRAEHAHELCDRPMSPSLIKVFDRTFSGYSVRPSKVEATSKARAPCLIDMETCGTAHSASWQQTKPGCKSG